jgi:hypothetical protein
MGLRALSAAEVDPARAHGYFDGGLRMRGGSVNRPKDDKAIARRNTIVKDADNLAVWVSLERSDDEISKEAKLSLLNAEIQEICNAHISTLDDTLHKKVPRPNPVPRVFIEQGNELTRIIWLSWEE